jgi:hypothetical protein
LLFKYQKLSQERSELNTKSKRLLLPCMSLFKEGKLLSKLLRVLIEDINLSKS